MDPWNNLAQRATEVNPVSPFPISSRSFFGLATLGASFVPVPGVVVGIEALGMITESIASMSDNQEEMRLLQTEATEILHLILRGAEKEQIGKPRMQEHIYGAVRVLISIVKDSRERVELGTIRRFYHRHTITAKVASYRRSMQSCKDMFSMALGLVTLAMVEDLQRQLVEACKTKETGTKERVEAYLSDIRNQKHGETADKIPAELKLEEIRMIGIESGRPTVCGNRFDIYEGQLLGQEAVALKLPRMRAEQDQETFMRRYNRHIEVWRGLQHPNVLRLYGFWIRQNLTYFVCPWVRNGNVKVYLTQRNGDRDKEGIPIIKGMALGLQYIHRQGVLHGDIQPSSILIAEDGRAQISDFSFARFCLEGGSTDTRTGSGQMDGMRYHAPETEVMDATVGKPADVFSWGRTALEVVSGRCPYFASRKLAEIISQHDQPLKSEDYPCLVLREYPDLWELLERCWRKDPEERPTMDGVVTALDRMSPLSPVPA